MASGAPSISARPGRVPFFISRLYPGPSGAGGKIKAKRSNTWGYFMWNKTLSHIGAVKASHKHEVVGSKTGCWLGGIEGK